MAITTSTSMSSWFNTTATTASASASTFTNIIQHGIGKYATATTVDEWLTNPPAYGSSIFMQALRIAVEERIHQLRKQGWLIQERKQRAVMGPMDWGLVAEQDTPFDNRIVYGWELRDAGEYTLPDGTVLAIDRDGNVKIDDSKSKVIYKANRIRDFNPYINASDLLELFIKDVGAMGVLQSEVLHLPVEAFINWVILQAAKRDGDPTDDLPPVQKALPPPPTQPRCGYCKRWIRKAWSAAGINFCSPIHMERKMQLLGAT